MTKRFISMQTLKRRWDAIRAGWPTLLIPFFGSVVVIDTGQGREALYAMTARPFLWIAFLAMTACGAILHARFIAAINEHYPFSSRAIPPNRPVPHAAYFAAASMPGVFLSFYGYEYFRAAISGPWGRGAFTCLAAMLFLFIWHQFVARRLLRVVQTHASRFLLWHRHLHRGHLFGLIALFLFATLVGCVPRLASTIGPISVFALGMTVWAIALNLAVTFIARRDWLPSPVLIGLVLFVLVGAAMRIVPGSHYPLTTVKCAAGCRTRPQATALARRWILDRARQHEPVVAIVVIADGGGMRAAIETANVLAQLDSSTGGVFYDHLYALSGVSGGAVGIATYLAARARDVPVRQLPAAVGQGLEADHFSPLLAGLLLRDLPDLLIPIERTLSLDNRAQLFEQSLSEDWIAADEMAAPLEAAVNGSAPKGHAPPIALLNATFANGGGVETASNVEFQSTDDGDALCNVLDQLPPGETLTLATAAHFSARFPITDPPAELIAQKQARASGACKRDVGTRLVYVDGGYADNTGATAALHALQALNSARQLVPSVDVRVVVLHIYASTNDPQDQTEIRDAGEYMRIFDDLRAPIQAVESVRYTLGLSPLKALCVRAASMNSDNAAEAQAGSADCGRLGSEQAYQGEKGVIFRLLDGSSCVPWINAALYVSAHSDEPEYVPLGWMLGPSEKYVVRQSALIARTIADRINANGLLAGSGAGNGCLVGRHRRNS